MDGRERCHYLGATGLARWHGAGVKGGEGGSLRERRGVEGADMRKQGPKITVSAK